MVKIQFPGVKINKTVLKSGQLIDTWLLGVHILIPYTDVQILPDLELWKPFVLFDTDDIVNAFSILITAIPEAVWNFITSWLEQQVEEYEKTHKEE